jgi:hypothetical protein
VQVSIPVLPEAESDVIGAKVAMLSKDRMSLAARSGPQTTVEAAVVQYRFGAHYVIVTSVC